MTELVPKAPGTSCLGKTFSVSMAAKTWRPELLCERWSPVPGNRSAGNRQHSGPELSLDQNTPERRSHQWSVLETTRATKPCLHLLALSLLSLISVRKPKHLEKQTRRCFPVLFPLCVLSLKACWFPFRPHLRGRRRGKATPHIWWRRDTNNPFTTH